jgi:hypothetical protein
MLSEQHPEALRIRRADPLTVARDPAFAEALAGLKLPPWDVITSREFAACAGVSPQTLADWRWRQDRAAFVEPPCEPKALYAGRIRYYRVDVLTAWGALDGLRMLDRPSLWPMAADYLHQELGLRRPATHAEVNDTLKFLHANDIIRPRHPSKGTFAPYER